MGWFYEVDITDDIFDDSNERLEDKDGRIIVQGKNSKRDYEGYYMDQGKPFRYPSISDLMPETEGTPEDVRLIAAYGDINSDGGFIYFEPFFQNGKWYVNPTTNKEGSNE